MFLAFAAIILSFLSGNVNRIFKKDEYFKLRFTVLTFTGKINNNLFIIFKKREPYATYNTVIKSHKAYYFSIEESKC